MPPIKQQINCNCRAGLSAREPCFQPSLNSGTSRRGSCWRKLDLAAERGSRLDSPVSRGPLSSNTSKLRVCLRKLDIAAEQGSRLESPELKHVKSAKLLAKVRPSCRAGLSAREPRFEGLLDSRSIDLGTPRLGRHRLENPSKREPFKRPCLGNPIDLGDQLGSPRLEIHPSETCSNGEGSLEFRVLDFKTINLGAPSAQDPLGNTELKIPRHENPNSREIVMRSSRLERPRLESLPSTLNSRALDLRAPRTTRFESH